MNKKTLLFSLIISLLFTVEVFAQTNIKVSGVASKGGKIVRVSANTEYKLMETYPLCVVTVFNAGTLTPSTIFSDEIGTAKANPFTSGSDASYSFYVAPGRYDIRFSGTGIISPFTISDVFVATGGGGGGGSVTSFNGRTGVVVPVAGDYSFSGLNFSGSNFNSIATRSASDLNAGTLPDAVFPAILPAVSGINLTNLNANNIASGTLADARLSANVPLKNATNTFTNNNLFTGTSVGIGTTGPDRKLDVLDPSNAQLRLSAVDGSVFTDFYTDSGGNINILPTGNITFDATGNQINPLNNYDQNLGQVNKKYLGLWAAELNVETLVAQNTIATIGGRIIVAPTNQLIADLSPVATTINVKYNNFFNGDRVYMEGNGGVEFFAITSGASVITGGFSYTVTRNLDGTGANQWYAGDAMVDTGVSGNGFIDLYSIHGVKSGTQLGPTIVGNVRNSSTYNDWTERWALGNLNGLFGYGVDTYGAAFGNPTGAWIKIDPTNGVRIGFNATTKTQIDAAGNATFTGTITAAAGSIAGWTINPTNIQSGTTYLASAFDVPAGQVAWFGRNSAGSQGYLFRDSANHFIDSFANAGIMPYFRIHDGAHNRVVIGGLNFAWEAEGSVTSMGMKVWDSTGLKLVEFSDVQNTIGGWNITSTKISGTGVDLVSGANAYLSFGVTPPIASNSGTGIFLDRTGLYGLNAGVTQAKFNATNGKITAGNNSVVLDTNGITITQPDAATAKLFFFDNLVNSLVIGGFNGDSFIRATGAASGGISPNGRIIISAVNNTTTQQVALNLTNNGSSSLAALYSPTGTFAGLRLGDGSAPTATLDVVGDTKTNSVQWNTGSKPSCNSGNRGKVWYVAGGAGVLDTFEVCRKDAADAYAWVTLF